MRPSVLPVTTCTASTLADQIANADFTSVKELPAAVLLHQSLRARSIAAAHEEPAEVLVERLYPPGDFG